MATALLACSSGNITSDPSAGTILARVGTNGQLTIYSELSKLAGIDDILDGTDPITVLAPNDKAWNKLGEAELNRLRDPANKDQLVYLLKFGIFNGSYDTDKLAMSKQGKNLVGQDVLTRSQGRGPPMIQGSTSVLSSFKGSNGRLHIIDAVLNADSQPEA